MKKYDLVVARYTENLDWILKLNLDRINVVVYNKGKNDIPFSFIHSENPGHGSESFIRYIVEHYNNFPEYVVFVQGFPFDHCSSAIEKINEHTDENFVVLSDAFLTDRQCGRYEHLIKRPEGYPLTMLDEAAQFCLGYTPEEYKFSAGEQYIIHSSFLYNQPKEVYEKILERYKWDYSFPWHMERIYPLLWKAL